LKEVFDQRFDAELLSTYGETLGFHIYLTEEVKKQSDMEGLRIRTSVLQQPLLRALKTQLIDVPVPEVFTALERKMVDGYSFSSLGIHDMGWDTMTGYRVDPKFYNIIFNVFLSNKSKGKLSDIELDYLRQAALQFEDYIGKALTIEAEKEYARQESIGIKSVDFGEEYADLARKLYWDEITSRSEFGAELKKLMDK
jgi:TRAP-type C4-dicarboxylate transport system substrate-binding protein